jgi:hypothetical protein
MDNTLYYTFTDKLIDICFAKQSDINRLRKVYDNPIAKNATPPVIKSITAPVIKTITAQYKTKISIINKDTNKKDFSFSSSFKNHKTNTKPHGFTTMSGSVWKILADIKERQKISSMKNKQITRSNL